MKATWWLALSLVSCGVPAVVDAGLPPNDGGLELVAFEPPSVGAVKNAFLVTVTGESGATAGLPFPPSASGTSAWFIDGWELRFSHVVVTVGEVTLHQTPERNPNDPSQTGPLVAELIGPWAVDLTKPGSLASKELNGTSVPLGRLTNQNRVPGSPAFDSTTRYALGFTLMRPVGEVKNVNLDAEAQSALRTMHERGWTVWMQGVATWRGEASTPPCRQTADYDFTRQPREVRFSFGFTAPVTFKNCLNPELQPSSSRGVQTQVGAETVAQLTFHLDHPFWEALEEDAPLRFDELASLGSRASGPVSTVSLTEADLVGVDFQGFADAQGHSIPWRTCGPAATGERTTGTLAWDPVNVPANPLGGSAGLKDLADYMTYNLSTFGHLNNDGVCFPARAYPSPH